MNKIHYALTPLLLFGMLGSGTLDANPRPKSSSLFMDEKPPAGMPDETTPKQPASIAKKIQNRAAYVHGIPVAIFAVLMKLHSDGARTAGKTAALSTITLLLLARAEKYMPTEFFSFINRLPDIFSYGVLAEIGLLCHYAVCSGQRLIATSTLLTNRPESVSSAFNRLRTSIAALPIENKQAHMVQLLAITAFIYLNATQSITDSVLTKIVQQLGY